MYYRFDNRVRILTVPIAVKLYVVKNKRLEDMVLKVILVNTGNLLHKFCNI